MKRKVLATTCSLFAACLASVLLAPKMIETRVLAGANADGSVTINETNFPDATLRNAIKSDCDENNDGKLSGEELDIGSLVVENGTVNSLAGLEYLNSLKYISFRDCQVNTFDLSQTSITELDLRSCSNTSISLAKATQLKVLQISDTPISTLDLSSVKNLEKLSLEKSTISSLNLSYVKNLQILYLKKTKISNLDLSGLSKLKYLTCQNTMVTSLDVSKNTLLESLDCDETYHEKGYAVLAELKVAGATSLEFIKARDNDIRSLELTNNPALIKVDCSYNHNLTKLDLSGAPNLKKLNILYHKLTSLDVSKNTNLTELLLLTDSSSTCSFGKLDLSNHGSLLTLSCCNLGLTELILPTHNVIQELICSENKLTSLDLSNADRLQELSCSNNQITNLKFPSSLTYFTKINVSSNPIGTLDLSGARNLKTLYCRNCGLTTLSLSGRELEYLSCESNQIQTLNLENLPNLKSLDCSYNNIETLDLSNNLLIQNVSCNNAYGEGGSKEDVTKKKLTKLIKNSFTYLIGFQCDGTALKALDLSNCPALERLLVGGPYLESLNLKNDSSLKSLSCNDLNITSLDVSGCTALESISVQNTKLRKLDLSGCASLNYVACQNNDLNTLTLTGCTSLETLYCYNTAIGSLEISGLANLKRFEAYSSALTSLKVSGATALEYMDVHDNALSQMTLSGLSSLKTLDCSSNRLKSFPTSSFPSLLNLDCSTNEITFLALNTMPKLEEVDCRFNQITFLDTSKNSNLSRISCYGNQFAKLSVVASPKLKACMNGQKSSYIFSDGKGNYATANRYVPLASSKYSGYASIDCDAITTLVQAVVTPAPVTDKSVEIGKSFQYTVYGVSSSSIKWSVGNTAIATVSTNGTVTGKSYGNTYLYAALPNGSTIKCLVRVVYPALKINYTEKTLHINQTFQFSVSNAYGQKITWSVGNTSVATVDANGKVKGKSAANTYLYAKSADGRVAKCLVKIINPGTLGINYTEKTVYLGQTFTFTAKNKGILTPTWSVGNTAIAKVDSNGKVTPVSAGNTYLYVKTADGRSAKCLVKVVDPGPLNIRYTEKTIKVGETFQFAAKNPAGQKVTWRVGNTSVATVDANGKVTGKSVANTWLYASTPDGREVKCLLKIVA